MDIKLVSLIMVTFLPFHQAFAQCLGLDCNSSQESSLLKAASALVHPDKLEMVVDNDRAFQLKLNTIIQAQRTLDLVYYIYSDDYSSSKLNEALIERAKAGVKIRLLVDTLTNANNLDLFRMLEQEGRDQKTGEQNLQVSFYGRPTTAWMKDAFFLTMSCPKDLPSKDCSQWKEKQVNQEFNGKFGRSAAQLLAQLFTTAVFTKNLDLAQLVVVGGQGLSQNSIGGDGNQMSDKDKQDLKELLSLYSEARLKKDPLALIKLQIAMALYGSKIQPIISLITSTLPLDTQNIKTSLKDWIYLTDYTHHKLLLADSKVMQLGGRNIEDPYHMNPNPLMKRDNGKIKYTFMDTDLFMTLERGGDKVRQSYDRLWNFTDMVLSLNELETIINFEWIARKQEVKQALSRCMQESMPMQASCVEEALALKGDERTQRISQKNLEMKQRSKAFEAYKPLQTKAWLINQHINDDSIVAYLENLSFHRGNSRLYGAKNGKELGSGKAIHEALIGGIERACKEASLGLAPKRMIFHQAYLFMPSNLARTLGRAIRNDIECKGVRISILTNSAGTTDLFPVNILAAPQLRALLETSKKFEGRGASIELLEYLEPTQAGPYDRFSLHSKVAVIGSDVLVGSANFDVRSFMMDTNNGIYLRKVPQLANEYSAYFDSLLKGAGSLQVGEVPMLYTDPKLLKAAIDALQLREDVLRYLPKQMRNLSDKQFAQLLYKDSKFHRHVLIAFVLAQAEVKASREHNEAAEAIQKYPDLVQMGRDALRQILSYIDRLSVDAFEGPDLLQSGANPKQAKDEYFRLMQQFNLFFGTI